jgi:hypothetical protein
VPDTDVLAPPGADRGTRHPAPEQQDVTTVLSLSYATAEIANDRRRVLLAEAEAHRRARAATRSHTSRWGRFMTVSALVRRGRSSAAARSGMVSGAVVEQSDYDRPVVTPAGTAS